MQSSTPTTFVRSTPTTSTSPSSPSSLTLDKLERLAVARLQHTVNELQTQVDKDRTALQPVRKIFHCVCDETALTANIPDLKRFVAEKSITMIVPFSALDSLDHLKKGTDNTSIHARESIRFFDRVQTTAGRKQITGVRIQAPTEKYENWAECITAAAAAAARRTPPSSPILTDFPEQEPPSRIKELLNCTVYHLNRLRSSDDTQVLLVTNDETVAEWAELYNIPTVSSKEVETMVRREDIEFVERKRHYEYAVNHPRSPGSPYGGGGRGRGGSRRGGWNGGRRDSWKEEDRTPPRGRGGVRRDASPPDFVLRGPPRGVARGRGKLWEP